jgi:Uma2 family endonuclease
MSQTRLTINYLAEMPTVEGERYELIDRVLHVTTQPHTNHQVISANLSRIIGNWCVENDSGLVVIAPGVIFDIDNGVAPDVAWLSSTRYDEIYDKEDGKLHGSPELMIEVLSPDNANVRRDKDYKLHLYSREGVLEYWIISWQDRQVEVYRRVDIEGLLSLVETLNEADSLATPLLKDFSCKVKAIFRDIKA